MDDQRADRAGGRVRFHKLRIAWSVWLGLAAVLLIVLCVRSYFTFDRCGIILAQGKVLVLVSNSGHLSAVVTGYHPDIGNGGWDHGPLAAKHNGIDPLWPATTFAGFGWISGAEYDFVPNYPMRVEWEQLDLIGRSWTENASGLIFPTWIALIPLFVLELIGWFGISTRFSLRALLIATTLVAVVLGLIVYVTRQ